MRNYTTNWSNLSGVPTSGGFYGGAAGVNGMAVGDAWTYAGVTATGTRTGNTTLAQARATQLTGGNMYYTMGTTANTGGEVRGQMTATAVQ